MRLRPSPLPQNPTHFCAAPESRWRHKSALAESEEDEAVELSKPRQSEPRRKARIRPESIVASLILECCPFEFAPNSLRAMVPAAGVTNGDVQKFPFSPS